MLKESYRFPVFRSVYSLVSVEPGRRVEGFLEVLLIHESSLQNTFKTDGTVGCCIFAQVKPTNNYNGHTEMYMDVNC